MARKRVITVSQLRCACLDADWRARWCAGENPPTMAFKGASGPPVQGTLFHTLVGQFTDWLVTGAPVAVEGTRLWKELYDRFAVRHLDKLIAQGMLPSAHHLSRALENFCHRLAALHGAAGADFRNWHDIFLTREYDLKRVKVTFPGGTMLVSGRPDAVRHVSGAGLEVVDYKLSRGTSLKEDLLQLAAYAHLLQETKPGLRFSGVLEYYEPALHVTPVSEQDLTGIWNEVIVPALVEIVAWPGGGTVKTTRPVGPQPPRPAVVERDEIGAKIEQTYANFQLKVRVTGKTGGPQLVRYQLEPGPGVKVVSLANRSEDLQVALHLREPPLIQAAPGCVTIDLPKDAPETVLWRDVIGAAHAPAAPLQFPVGVGVDGEVVTADFSDPNMCHALVAGVAGSGKSEFLKCVAASLIRANAPENLRLFLVDPKAVTFAPLARSRHLARPIMTDLPATLDFLEEAVREMDDRYLQLAAGGYENLTQRGADAAMPYWIIIFDEFADLILGGRKEKQVFESLVARLAQKGRAAGVHVILATQRPDRNVVTGLIKSNLPLKICLRVTSAVNSQIVLDAPGAESLLGRGDLLCDRGRGVERLQSPLISAQELRDLSVGN